MNDDKNIQAMNTELRQAVADIKTAILQGQYEAAKGVNRIQLAVYRHRQVCVAAFPQRHVGHWSTRCHQQPASQGTAGVERLFGNSTEKHA